MADRQEPRSTPPLTCRFILELYREQIRYLIAELHRIGWTPYPTEPNE